MSKRYSKTDKKENSGTKWTIDEEEKLLKLISDGKDLYDISDEHKRNVGGIINRLETISWRLYNNGKSIDEIYNVLKLISKDDIELAIKIMRNKKENEKIVAKNIIAKNNDIRNTNDEIISTLNDIKNMLKQLIEMNKKSNINNNDDIAKINLNATSRKSDNINNSNDDAIGSTQSIQKNNRKIIVKKTNNRLFKN